MPSSAEHRKKQRAAGYCASCFHRKAEDGITLCRTCRPKVAKHALNAINRVKARGLCTKCREPRGDLKTLCAKCTAEKKRIYADKVVAGLCTYCTEPVKAEIGQQCEKHWFHMICRTYGISTKTGVPMLRRLWEKQGGRCAITGDLLIKGNNASIDHITPRAKGGTNDESNLQWATLEANRLKWDLAIEELHSLCAKVLAKKITDAASYNAVDRPDPVVKVS